MADVLGGWRRKYLSFTQKVKEVVSPDGEVLVSVGTDGLVQLDGTPVAPPINYTRQASMLDIQRMQIAELTAQASRAAELEGEETWEEANDFDVGDDDEIRRNPTAYELDADPQYLAARDDLIDRHRNPDKYKEEPEAPVRVVIEAGSDDAEQSSKRPDSKRAAGAPKSEDTTED